MPVKGEAAVASTMPLGGIFIVFPQASQEVVRIVLREILDSKVVYADAKFCWTSVVFPKSHRSDNRFITVLEQVFLQVVVREDCGLFQAIHTTFDADEDMSILC